MNQANKAQILN